jgi:hypothetical protein
MPTQNLIIPGQQSQATPGPNTPTAQSKAVSLAIPFARSAKRHRETGDIKVVSSPATAAKTSWKIPTYGFLTGFSLDVVASGGTGTAAVYAEDGPFNIINDIAFTDNNGHAIQQLGGFSQHLSTLFGGYRVWRGDISTYAYSTPTSGNFHFKVFFFVEFGTDGLGALANTDAANAYNLQLSYNAIANVYSTQPTGVPTSVSYTLEMLGRGLPLPADPITGQAQEQQPPSPGTIQNWTYTTFTLASGKNTIQLTRVGNTIRQLILVFRATDGTRATAESGGTVPTSMLIKLDTQDMYDSLVSTLRNAAYEVTGVDAPDGIIPLIFGEDTGINGHELGESWIPTAGSTKFQLIFSTTAAGTLEVVTNDIVEGSGSMYQGPLAIYQG